MTDYISRKAVIEVLNETIATPSVMLDTLVKRIEELPPAQQWIQCSERLPEEDGLYLVWILWDYDESPTWSLVNYDTCAEGFGDWIDYYDTETYGLSEREFNKAGNVLAWMHLPEPYKENSDAND